LPNEWGRDKRKGGAPNFRLFFIYYAGKCDKKMKGKKQKMLGLKRQIGAIFD
jgi:hypothetical protein